MSQQFQPYRFKHYRDLRDAGYDYEMFHKARAFFAARGICIGFSRKRKEWFFCGFPKNSTPGTCEHRSLWCGAGAFIDYLDAPSEVFKGFND